MIPIRLYEIIEAVGGVCSGEDAEISLVSTDTRTIEKGSVFVCIKGERFDGHDFAKQAFEKGAEAVISEREIEGVRCIIVEDTLRALGAIARYYRSKFASLHLVGVTGSVGKTSTKEMIYLVMSQAFDTLKTVGSLNNEIGLPHTMFNITASTQAAVIEMGMSHLGEISRLSSIARPELCVITNIGTAHIGNLGSQENILKAKLEIFDGADKNAPLVTSLDDPMLSKVTFSDGRKKYTYSITDTSADVYASDIVRDESGSDFCINYRGGSMRARVNVSGDHNILNALCAFTVGLYYGIEPDKMVSAIAQFATDGVRQNRTEKDGIHFMLDCFNASPEAMYAALDVFANAKSEGRRIALLADMLELGEGSKEYHKRVGERFAETCADMLICYGEDAKQYAEGAKSKGYSAEKCIYFGDEESLKSFLKKELQKGDLVLIKGSHGMKLDKIYKELYNS